MSPEYERLLKNMPAISQAEQRMLLGRKIFIAGCGGLGGWIAEYMARLGIGEITAAGPDVFEVSNMNRQLGADTASLGESKALTLKRRMALVAPGMSFTALPLALESENAAELIRGSDLVFDALDGIEARLALEDACAAEGITLVHGAVRGWSMQTAVVPPGSGMLARIYANASEPGDSTVLPFTPACCAAVQCAQAAALLLGRPCELFGKLLTADLLTMQQQIIEI